MNTTKHFLMLMLCAFLYLGCFAFGPERRLRHSCSFTRRAQLNEQSQLTLPVRPRL